MENKVFGVGDESYIRGDVFMPNVGEIVDRERAVVDGLVTKP